MTACVARTELVAVTPAVGNAVLAVDTPAVDGVAAEPLVTATPTTGDDSVALIGAELFPSTGLPAGDGVTARTDRRTPRSMMRGRTLRWTLVSALIIVEIALVVPNLSFSAAAFTDVDWSLLLLAVLCEALSIATFSRMRRGLLRAGGVHVPLRQMGVLTLASNAISATAPAGTAVSAAYLYQQLRRRGANTAVVVWVIVAGSVMSGLSFSVLTLMGALLDGDVSFGEIVGAAGVSLLVGVALVSGLAFTSRHPGPLLDAAERLGNRLPARWRGADANVVHAKTHTALDQLTAISPRTRDWSAAFLLSIINWSADLACFILCCHAVGADGLGLGAAVLAYVAGLATISLTLTPGGLGTVEAGMLLGLAHGGVAAPVALAGVVTYRLVAYVLVGAVGWGAWAGLRRSFRLSELRRAAVPDADAPDIAPAAA